jgi:hypothetical protein
LIFRLITNNHVASVDCYRHAHATLSQAHAFYLFIAIESVVTKPICKALIDSIHIKIMQKKKKEKGMFIAIYLLDKLINLLCLAVRNDI